MVMCKEAVRDGRFDFYSLRAVFSVLNFPKFPATYPRIDILIELENLFEPMQLIVSMQAGSHFYKSTVTPGGHYPSGLQTYVASFSSVSFPGAGEFPVSVTEPSGNLLAERILHIEDSSEFEA